MAALSHTLLSSRPSRVLMMCHFLRVRHYCLWDYLPGYRHPFPPPFFFLLLFQEMSNLGKSIKNITRNSQISFIWLHQVLTFCYIYFIISSLLLPPFPLLSSFSILRLSLRIMCKFADIMPFTSKYFNMYFLRRMFT